MREARCPEGRPWTGNGGPSLALVQGEGWACWTGREGQAGAADSLSGTEPLAS